MNPNQTISHFSHQTVAVVGDVMLDRYVYGKVDRISPEAPIPIVQRQETMLVPGGAGNTSANITALGGSCCLFGVIGDDSTGQELQQTLATFGIDTAGLIKDKRPTTEKIRVLGNHQQIVRIDHEANHELTATQIKRLVHALDQKISSCNAILVCDYAKGTITAELMDELRRLAHQHAIPLLADVRPEHKDWYHNLDYITPNRKETAGMVGQPVRSLAEAKEYGLQLAEELGSNILLTMSEDGLLLIHHHDKSVLHLPTRAQEVVDVSGAGDTVIAAFTLALTSQATPKQAATIANHAASLVVAKLGTATASQAELQETFS